MSVDVRLARPDDLPAVHALREDVFVRGQGVPAELEHDARDADAVHAVALQGGEVVGTGRLLLDRDGPAGVGRMAVAEPVRGQGVGAALLALLEREAAAHGRPAVELHAQLGARGFYDRLGYTATSDVYEEAGIAHVSMRKPLPVVREVRDDDSAALIALIGGCWTEYPGVELHVDVEEPWLRAPASAYRDKGGRMWVVELDGDVVASCGARPVRAGVFELKSMYVTARARRHGIARLLEQRVLDEARRRGAGRVELWSDTRFLDAHATYARLGYARLPGERDLHDLSHSREYAFAKDL